MTRLILTTDASAAGAVMAADRADLVIPVELRLVWGPPRSDAELAAFLAPRTIQKPDLHWLDYAGRAAIETLGGNHLGLRDVCTRYDIVELWIEPEANAQLVLIWLLDYFHSHANSATNLVLCHVDASLGEAGPKQRAKWKFQNVGVTNDHLEIARLAWQAYRARTPEAWFNLLARDLSILPQLPRCVLDMLEELPGHATGLGASEMRILELVSAGYAHPFDVFSHFKPRFQRPVFDYWESGALLDHLAHAPSLAVSGLQDGPFTVEMHDSRERFDRYKASRLSLTPLGEAILLGRDDFSRHNPVHRWWGGTELTDANLWRWDPVAHALVAP